MKPSSLTSEEVEIVRRHPEEGAKIVGRLGSLQAAVPAILHHHERWDGTGYPDGLEGAEIPLAARVFAVADTLDALTTDRPYRPAATLTYAREVIVAASGTQFDPDVVAAFNDVPDAEFDRIRLETGI
jgi:ribonuclease P protein subunit RPR2